MREVIIALVMASSCGFSTRSEEFECGDSEDCPDDRFCESGWCVTMSEIPPIECDEDVPCVVDCATAGSCGGGVDCSGASSCTVTCSGDGSCAGHIECGAGPCDIECSGPASCAGTIDCDGACSCDLVCSGGGSCGNDVDCPHTGQCKEGKECHSSGPATCNQC